MRCFFCRIYGLGVSFERVCVAHDSNYAKSRIELSVAVTLICVFFRFYVPVTRWRTDYKRISLS